MPLFSHVLLQKKKYKKFVNSNENTCYRIKGTGIDRNLKEFVIGNINIARTYNLVGGEYIKDFIADTIRKHTVHIYIKMVK